MAAPLSKQAIISVETLREVAEARLAEAQTLLGAGHYGAAIYLGGYAFECYLKVAVCFSLAWDALLGTFKVHDLDGLLMYSGFYSALRADENVFESFAKASAMWSLEGNASVRYRRPAEFDQATAKRFLEYVCDPQTGVVPWLRKRVS